MDESNIPTLLKHGKEIGRAAELGDKEAQKIIDWYSSSRKISDEFGISLAEILAEKWIKKPKDGQK